MAIVNKGKVKIAYIAPGSESPGNDNTIYFKEGVVSSDYDEYTYVGIDVGNDEFSANYNEHPITITANISYRNPEDAYTYGVLDNSRCFTVFRSWEQFNNSDCQDKSVFKDIYGQELFGYLFIWNTDTYQFTGYKDLELLSNVQCLQTSDNGYCYIEDYQFLLDNSDMKLHLKSCFMGDVRMQPKGQAYNENFTLNQMFADATYLEYIEYPSCTIQNYSGSANYMFSNCQSITRVDIHFLNNIHSTIGMFEGCRKLSSVYISHFDLSDSVSYNLSDMFKGCSRLSNLNVTELWMDNIDSQYILSDDMFLGCVKLPDYDSENVSISESSTYCQLYSEDHYTWVHTGSYYSYSDLQLKYSGYTVRPDLPYVTDKDGIYRAYANNAQMNPVFTNTQVTINCLPRFQGYRTQLVVPDIVGFETVIEQSTRTSNTAIFNVSYVYSIHSLKYRLKLNVNCPASNTIYVNEDLYYIVPIEGSIPERKGIDSENWRLWYDDDFNAYCWEEPLMELSNEEINNLYVDIQINDLKIIDSTGSRIPMNCIDGFSDYMITNLGPFESKISLDLIVGTYVLQSANDSADYMINFPKLLTLVADSEYSSSNYYDYEWDGEDLDSENSSLMSIVSNSGKNIQSISFFTPYVFNDEQTQFPNIGGGITTLSSLDLHNLDTHSITSLEGAFENTYIESLDVSPMFLANVDNVSRMIANNQNISEIRMTNLNGFFIDADSANWTGFANGCRSLETIYVNDSFFTGSMENAESVMAFDGCESIAGPWGTTYEGGSSIYAQIDGGENHKGYFTKWGVL